MDLLVLQDCELGVGLGLEEDHEGSPSLPWRHAPKTLHAFPWRNPFLLRKMDLLLVPSPSPLRKGKIPPASSKKSCKGLGLLVEVLFETLLLHS